VSRGGASVRALLATLGDLGAAGVTEADIARMLAAVDEELPARKGAELTGQEAAERARAVLARLVVEHPEIATPEARATWERVLSTVEGFDDDDG
jgi:hypothetical protein